MDKTSTPQISPSSAMTERGRKRPSAITLAIIRQFARNYHVEQQLNQAVNSVILN
ncbi:MAG: hypothetical protein HDS75_07250 [Bacteroidales bacterium]|nr:hypothetical protein [Bacteroidales bacterium]MDE6801161.1 hypothetical protein [Muribaculaceae bacterium]